MNWDQGDLDYDPLQLTWPPLKSFLCLSFSSLLNGHNYPAKEVRMSTVKNMAFNKKALWNKHLASNLSIASYPKTICYLRLLLKNALLLLLDHKPLVNACAEN